MSVSILGIRIDEVTEKEAIDQIIQASTVSKKYIVSTINPEFIMAAQQDSHFKSALNNADLALADGIGILWAANLLSYKSKINNKLLRLLTIWVVAMWYGVKTFLSLKFRTARLPQQVTGSNLTQSLAAAAARYNQSLFLLGEKSGIAEKAAIRLKQAVPGLTISGTFAGDGSASGDKETCQVITKHPADIVLVAYGAPKQELWLERNLAKVPAWVGIGVGGTFRFLAGDVRRAPVWVQRLGLEWLFRLALEPWRWKRQLALPRFVWAVTWSKINQTV